MKALLLVLNLLVLGSCGGNKFTSATESAVSVNKITIEPGNYQSTCESSGGGWDQVKLTVTDTTIISEYTLYSNAGCTTPFYRMYAEQDFVKIALENANDEETILVDLAVKSIRYVWNHSWYVNQNYCGLSWVLNVEKEVAGVTNCPILSSRPGNTFRSIGQVAYFKMKIRPQDGYIGFPLGSDLHGDTENDRFGENASDLWDMTKTP